MTRCSIFEIPAAAEAGATTELVALRFDDLPGLNAANEEVPAADPLRNTLTRADSVLSFPPGGLIGRDEQAILSAFDQRVRHLHSLARAGVYPKCRGQMQTGSKCCLETALRTADTCKQCQHSLLSSPLLSALILLDASPVVAFYRDHGLDLGTPPYWRLDWCVSDDYTTVRATGPWRIAVSIGHNDDTLSATLDVTLAVPDITRETPRSVS